LCTEIALTAFNSLYQNQQSTDNFGQCASLSGHKFELTPKMDNDILAKFIRVKKYDVESAAKAFKNYYTHIFKNLDRVKGIKPSQYITAFESRAFVVLKKPVNGSRVILQQINAWNPSLFHMREFQDGVLLTCEELSKNAETQPYGSIVIADLTGLSFSQVKQCTPRLLKYAVTAAVVSLDRYTYFL